MFNDAVWREQVWRLHVRAKTYGRSVKLQTGLVKLDLFGKLERKYCQQAEISMIAPQACIKS